MVIVYIKVILMTNDNNFSLPGLEIVPDTVAFAT